MQTGLHRNTISKVYRQLETDGVVEAMAGSGIYVRDQQARNQNATAHPQSGVTDLDREVRKCVDGLLKRAAPCSKPGAADPGDRLAAALRPACW